MTFASLDDYESMIEADLRENPPAQSDDDEEDGEDGEDDDQLDAALASDDEVDEKRRTPSPKQPTPRRVTRSSMRAKPHGRNPSGKETSAVMVEIRVVERMREAWHVRV